MCCFQICGVLQAIFEKNQFYTLKDEGGGDCKASCYCGRGSGRFIII